MEPLRSVVLLNGGNGVHHLTLAGDFDIAEVADLHSRLQFLVDHPPRVLTVTMANVDYIGAAGVRELAQMQSAIRNAGGSMRVVACSSIARRVVQLFGNGLLDAPLCRGSRVRMHRRFVRWVRAPRPKVASRQRW